MAAMTVSTDMRSAPGMRTAASVASTPAGYGYVSWLVASENLSIWNPIAPMPIRSATRMPRCHAHARPDGTVSARPANTR